MPTTYAIPNGRLYMAPVLYTGTGTNGLSITGVGFQTDFNWTKSRSSASYSHQLSDSNRGFSKYLYSNSTAAEGTDATNHIQSVNSDGYVINSGASFNASGITYVAWNWLCNAGSTSSNTSGTITSTVEANTTAGFSVATYTGNGSAGATFGHGLGVAPSFVIIKERGNVNGWLCYHISTGNTGYIELDSNIAFQTLSTFLNNTTPSSTVVTLGTVSNVNRSGGTFVAYCFAPIAGYSAFGSYTGNGSTDGPFVYTGFRPRFVLIKISSGSTGSWWIWDSGRNTFNAASNILAPDSSGAEISPYNCDLLSNGFKLRDVTGALNGSGYTFIYAAFAENPFKYANAR
jgi:hypothetical protein